MLHKLSRDDITNPNTWLMMFLASALGGGGATFFDSDKELIAEKARAANEREKAQWELIAQKADDDEIRDYIDLSIRAECR